jgi:hypothetical protein
MKSGRPTGLPTCLKRLSRFEALPYPPSLGGWLAARSWRARVVNGAAEGLKSGRRRWAEMLAARLWPAIGTGLPRLG